MLKNIPFFTKYSLLLFSRTHGYVFALVFLLTACAWVFRKSK